MYFSSRKDAGRRLAHSLRELAVEVDLVVGLPRGGVVVAAEVAEALRCPLEAMVVRKIGHPEHREFALGALAEEGVVVLDMEVLARSPVNRSELGWVIAEERLRLHEYCLKFHEARQSQFAGCRVLLVDDGLATGASAEAAVRALRKRQASQIIIAAPVASLSAHERLNRIADRVVTLLTDPELSAVGGYYDDFSPTEDTEVLALLRRHPTNYPLAVAGSHPAAATVTSLKQNARTAGS
jgi:predicted phosphoribosyltransferase